MKGRNLLLLMGVLVAAHINGWMACNEFYGHSKRTCANCGSGVTISGSKKQTKPPVPAKSQIPYNYDESTKKLVDRLINGR